MDSIEEIRMDPLRLNRVLKRLISKLSAKEVVVLEKIAVGFGLFFKTCPDDAKIERVSKEFNAAIADLLDEEGR